MTFPSAYSMMIRFIISFYYNMTSNSTIDRTQSTIHRISLELRIIEDEESSSLSTLNRKRRKSAPLIGMTLTEEVFDAT